jgi:predicted MFS family arabinose efflux permease
MTSDEGVRPNGAGRRGPRLAPLLLATMASQALLVVLAPTIAAIAADMVSSVGVVGQARTVTAAVAIGASFAIARRIDTLGVRRMLRVGAVLAGAACLAVATSSTLAAFLAAHGLVGIAFACLLSAGFAGVAAFPPERRPWAMGYVAGANALAWIVVNPVVGALTHALSWRAAQGVPAIIALAALASTRGWLPSPGGQGAAGMRTVVGQAPARRWLVAEVTAFASWTALLTFLGAFFIERHGAGEAAVGWFLAAGAGAYFVASSRGGALARRVPRRRLVAVSALVMAALLPVQLAVSPSLAFTVGVFCALGLAGGIRTPASSELALAQLPDTPGAMMAARTAATQLGYLVGAVVGGLVIANAGYGPLGVLLAAGMGLSALLVLRLDDPAERIAGAPERAPLS